MGRARSVVRKATAVSLEDEITRLRDLDGKTLRARWRTVLGGKAPAHLPRHLLFAMIAYRLQAEVFGDLDAETLRLLKKIELAPSKTEAVPLTEALYQRRRELTPGTVLLREWNGQTHRVTVVEQGFAWQGLTQSIANRAGHHRHQMERSAVFWPARAKIGGIMTSAVKAIRCAIYTRVSTEAGLDQEFNSLDAQYDAASAYIRSQAHAHWTLVRTRYDDGGFSGGSTDRPALQRLLADVKARKIRVVVVYKVDRLTRSLADFAKLVELFDAHGVSFVSVTQQFNTTTSMGRLTLNVLLSFAQFEREVTAERIRDKIAASKRKGLWVGGMVPLGYALKDGKLRIVEEEAEQVRTIFKRYLELGSVNRLVIELRVRNFRSRVRKLSTGQTRGGVAFTQGPLFYLLRNRFYIGEVRYKNEIFPGPQPPLLERELFEAVQAKLTAQRSHRVTQRTKSAALLRGLLFDEAGDPMIPTHSTKHGVRYRYYVSQPHLRGIAKPPAGVIIRIPATEIESVVTKAVAEHLQSQTLSGIRQEAPDQQAALMNIARVEVRKNQLAVWLKELGSKRSATRCR
jgi:site-specific DNA recombinase